MSAGRFPRHAAVNDLIRRSLSSAGVPSRLEPSSLNRSDGKRPDGLSMIPWKDGRCMIWDFTCPDTLAKSHLDLAVSGAGFVATNAEGLKTKKYQSLVASYIFEPIAVETFGALGESATAFFKELGRRLAVNTGELRASQFLLQRLSVAVQRGNAASVMGTVGSSVQLDDLFYI